MKEFNREKFLLWLLAGLLAWQAGIFSFGTYQCTRVKAPQMVKDNCPLLGDRFETFANTSMGAILGLLAGSAALSAAKKNQKRERKEDNEL